MRLVVVGCSPAWPNPGGAQSGYLVEGAGRLLLDCGPGVLPSLRDREGWPHVDAIVITHFHLDHWGDIVPWAFGLMFGPGRDGRPVELWVRGGGGEQLSELGAIFGQPQMFEQAFRLREYADGETFRAAGYEITPMRVPHYDLETYGMRVSDGDRTLAYSGDSAPSPQLEALARGADLFLCEATLRDGVTEGSLRGHLSLEEAIDAFRASGASRLLVTHRPNELPVADGIEQARDGLELEL